MFELCKMENGMKYLSSQKKRVRNAGTQKNLTSVPLTHTGTQTMKLLKERRNRYKIRTRFTGGTRWQCVSRVTSIINLLHQYSLNDEPHYYMILWDEINEKFYLSSADFCYLIRNFEPGIL